MLNDDVPYNLTDIKIVKNDKRKSIAFISDEYDYSNPDFKNLQIFAAETESELDNLRHAEEKSKDKDPTSNKELEVPYWFFKDNKDEWVKYTKELNYVVEDGYQKLSKSTEEKKHVDNFLQVDYNSFKYTIYFDDNLNGQGYQVNETTNKARNIIRKMVQPGESTSIDFSSKELQVNPLKDIITDHPKGWIQLEHLSFKTSIFNTIEIDLKSPRAIAIKKLMEASMPGVEIYQIERIQNLAAYHKYTKEKELMRHKYYDEKIKLEHRLFHGTRETTPITLIGSEEGFDMRFSNEGLWGRGIYFADRAEYSNKYAYHLPYAHRKLKQIFLAKVLVGKPYKSETNKNYKYLRLSKEQNRDMIQ